MYPEIFKDKGVICNLFLNDSERERMVKPKAKNVNK